MFYKNYIELVMVYTTHGPKLTQSIALEHEIQLKELYPNPIFRIRCTKIHLNLTTANL